LAVSICFGWSTSFGADSLSIKIGQMIMVGIPGTSVNASSQVIQEIKQQRIGGVLLFENNINPNRSIVQLNVLCDDLQRSAKIPLFLSIDQEGGKVNRLKTKYGFAAMPSAFEIGQKNKDTFSITCAKTLARSVKSGGMNLNFAPVVDVHSANCPVLGQKQRCFSSSVKTITHIAEIMCEEHHKAGVMSCLKHFPGHGRSSGDSHLGLTDVSKTWKDEELNPYRELIKEKKVDMIMVAHVVNRQLDSSGTPSSLSKKIIQGVLRTELNYNGVVITDDMQMHAISNYYGLEQSIKLAINAGVDILIFSNNIKGSKDYTVANIHATIKRLVARGEIPESRINESFQRIMKLKSTYHLN
jgi:beta-N-acetylhexosaminidase